MKSPHAAARCGSLLEMPCGRKLLVEELEGSPSLRSRLYAMGILPGTEMELCGQACGKGSVCVRVRQCSLVLGESLARSIFCRPADDGVCPHHGHGPHWPWRRSEGRCRGGHGPGGPGLAGHGRGGHGPREQASAAVCGCNKGNSGLPA